MDVSVKNPFVDGECFFCDIPAEFIAYGEDHNDDCAWVEYRSQS